MIREDLKTKQLNCIDTISLLKEKIDYYNDLKAEKTQQIKYLETSGPPLGEIDVQKLSNEEIVKQYMENLEKVLVHKAFVEMDKNSQKSDTSMASNSQNAFEVLQDAQDPNEIEVNVEDVVESAREIISEKFLKKG